jgi:acetoin utilization protein AcuB
MTSKSAGIPPMKAIMTPFPYSVERGDPIARARSLMAKHGIRHLPVMDRGKLVGVVADRDITLALDPARGLPPEKKLKVNDACVRQAYVVESTEPLDNVLLQMAEKHIGSALVVKEGRLVGIFTATDACRRYGEFLRSLYPRGSGEAA